MLSRLESRDELDPFDVWSEYLQEVLKFPFEAEASEYQQKGHLIQGDKVRV